MEPTEDGKAYTRAWLDTVAAGKKQVMKVVALQFGEPYKTSMAKPVRLLQSVRAAIEGSPSSLHIYARSRRVGAEAALYQLQAAPLSMGDFDGLVLQAHRFLASKKVGHWTTDTAFAVVQTHALERLVERAQADGEVLREALRLVGLTSQAFNSAHCLGMDPKLPMLLPFRDGLLVGQSDMLAGLGTGTSIEFGKHGAMDKPLAQPGVAVLLGNPPRAMRIRTFIGGLRTNKARAHALLSDFFARHDATLRAFSRRALFEFDIEDTVHAIMQHVQASLRHVDAMEDSTSVEKLRALLAGSSDAAFDPLEVAFRDEGERATFRQVLEEYQQLLQDPAIKAVLERAETHVR